jgi:hypothetical protein
VEGAVREVAKRIKPEAGKASGRLFARATATGLLYTFKIH